MWIGFFVLKMNSSKPLTCLNRNQTGIAHYMKVFNEYYHNK